MLETSYKQRLVLDIFSPPVLFAGLLAAVISIHTLAPTIFSYAVISIFYVFAIIQFLVQEHHFTIRRSYALLYLLLVVVTFAHTTVSQTMAESIRLISLLTFTSINLILLPRIVPFRLFLITTSRISAVAVLVGFLPYLGFSPNLGIADLELWGKPLYVHPELFPITSIFYNPNILGFLTFVGCISAVGEWVLSDRSPIPKALFMLNIIGLIFSNYRSGMIGFIAVITLIAIYRMFGREVFVICTVGGLIFTTMLLLMVFGLLPGPTQLTETSLNNRRPLWKGAFQAFLDQPIFGHGFGLSKAAIQPYVPEPLQDHLGIHNSYLRMFVALGVVGGTIHLWFVFLVVVNAARQAMTPQTLFISLFLTGFAIVQIFTSYTFIGAFLHSTTISIVIGYHITGIQGNQTKDIICKNDSTISGRQCAVD